MDLRNKKIAILGLGKSGRAVADLVLHFSGKPKISEAAPQDASKLVLEDWPQKKRVLFEFGGHTQSFIEDSDMLVLSPGVRLDAPAVFWAQNKGIPVLGEIEFAWRFCKKPVIAVTGSNGKTTVSTLIAKVIEKSGKRVALCGNIGSAFSKHVLDLKEKEIVVLEISSFQLESITHFRPHVAVLLNFSQNHLDRHKDINEYFDAKKRIFLNQKKDDYAVLDYQNPSIRQLEKEIKSKVSFFNAPGIAEQLNIFNPNHLAAAEVGRVFGVSPQACKEVFAQFKGVEHRLEYVRTINGIDFINDSKSTTVEAGRWALSTLEKPIVMICGGRDKNLDFSVLRELVGRKVKKMLVIGEAKEKMKKAFADVVSVEECESFESAVARAQKSAATGDCVLLSPMCASYDMFKNFEERGRIFKELVAKL